MNVGFYLTWQKDARPYVLADILVRSVRRHLPGAKIVQLTDMGSAAVIGTDHVHRLAPEPMSVARPRHFEAVHRHFGGDWLFLDSDVMLQASVAHVFDEPFDVALADRNWPHAQVPDAFTKTMPYNAGVVFSRSASFWADVLWLTSGGQLRVDHSDNTFTREDQSRSVLRALDWYGDQRAICFWINSGKYNVKILAGMEYNYPPSHANDPAAGAKIVHCKGNRKDWMLQRVAV